MAEIVKYDGIPQREKNMYVQIQANATTALSQYAHVLIAQNYARTSKVVRSHIYTINHSKYIRQVSQVKAASEIWRQSVVKLVS